MNLPGITLEKYNDVCSLDLDVKVYYDGTPAVVSWCEGEPYDTLTVNVPDIPDRCLAVSSDMNPEYASVLHDAGIICSTSPVGWTTSGFTTISFYRMSDEASRAADNYRNYLSGIQ